MTVTAHTTPVDWLTAIMFYAIVQRHRARYRRRIRENRVSSVGPAHNEARNLALVSKSIPDSHRRRGTRRRGGLVVAVM